LTYGTRMGAGREREAAVGAQARRSVAHEPKNPKPTNISAAGPNKPKTVDA